MSQETCVECGEVCEWRDCACGRAAKRERERIRTQVEKLRVQAVNDSRAMVEKGGRDGRVIYGTLQVAYRRMLKLLDGGSDGN